MKFKIAYLLCLLLLASTSLAQNLIYGDKTEFPRVSPINPLNERFLIKQRQRVEEITRRNFGQQLGNGKENERLLQRIIDEKLISANQKLELQALGVVLGDLFADSHKNLTWRLFEDELGISHAVCVDDSKHCIFPVTMISRRIEAGATPRVDRLYNIGIDAIKAHLPRLPYSN